MRQIAIYGKGGIGKSTVASNLSMALAAGGRSVMQVGCDPKRDSTRTLTGGRLIPTVLETFRDQLRAGEDEYAIKLEEIVHPGPVASGSPGGGPGSSADGPAVSAGRIFCVESGGPEPGVGCAGRGVLTAIQILQDLKAFETYGIEIALYDVLGDVVCGGFAQPIRAGFAEEIYLVCSGEFMSLYAANNIAKAILRLSEQASSRLAGVILNSRGRREVEERVVGDFARRLGSSLIMVIPRSEDIQRCEVDGRTVVAGAPGSEAARAFGELAERVLANTSRVIPTPLEMQELEGLYREVLRSQKDRAGEVAAQ